MIPRYRPTLDTSALIGSLLNPRSIGVGTVITLEDMFFQISASHGLLHAIRTLKLTGTIVMPAYTCERVVAAALAAGCKPRFVDIAPDSGTMDPHSLLAALAERPAVVLATHIFGVPCDMPELMRAARQYDVVVIEDCALASGTVIEGHRAGDWGDIALFSFGVGKTVNLGYGGAIKINSAAFRPIIKTYLESGAVVQHSPVTTIRTLMSLAMRSNLAWRCQYELVEIAKTLLGRSSRARSHPGVSTIRPTHLSATEQKILLGILSSLDQEKFARHCRTIGDIYSRGIQPSERLRPLVNPRIAYQALYPCFPLRTPARESLHVRLRQARIDSSLFFSYSAADISGDTRCPHSRELAQEIICLPVHAAVSEDAAHAICDIVNDWSTR